MPEHRLPDWGLCRGLVEAQAGPNIGIAKTGVKSVLLNSYLTRRIPHASRKASFPINRVQIGSIRSSTPPCYHSVRVAHQLSFSSWHRLKDSVNCDRPSMAGRHAFRFGTDLWDPTHRFETSWLLSPWALFFCRALIVSYRASLSS